MMHGTYVKLIDALLIVTTRLFSNRTQNDSYMMSVGWKLWLYFIPSPPLPFLHVPFNFRPFVPTFTFLFSFFFHLSLFLHSILSSLSLYTSFLFHLLFLPPSLPSPPLYISSFVIHALSFSLTTSISCEIQIASIGDASFARPAIVPDDGVSAYEKVSTRLNCLL